MESAANALFDATRRFEEFAARLTTSEQPLGRKRDASGPSGSKKRTSATAPQETCATPGIDAAMANSPSPSPSPSQEKRNTSRWFTDRPVVGRW